MAEGKPEGLQDILRRLEQAGEERDWVSVGDMQAAMGERSYGPFLLVPAVVEMSPVGGVPGVPTVLAAMIVIFAAQMMLGRRRFWMPRLLRERSVRGGRLRRAAGAMRPLGRWTDRVFHGRLRGLVRWPAVRVAAGLCILLCLTVPLLELIPFASTVPMAAIALFGLAMLVKDGLLMLLTGVLALAALGLGVGWLGGWL
ncbi:exopolysaccharide biosynthesis protein [Pseudoroseomonas globiformis]|uniref:Exopolysaccharide biosynthesis protein n=1 Tax=Teichococcus globiformis TaxID=2307229 RepID=A0ABV7FY34_9PROT